MKLKRVFASISGGFESLVSSVENHEAVAECAIKDVRLQTARINAQLQQNRHRVDQLSERENKLSQQKALWKQRAKRSAGDRREQALRCLTAMKNCENELQQVCEQRERAQCLVNELQDHLNEAEQKMLELQTKKDSLSARAARNKVVKSVNSDGCAVEDTDAVFLRWEEKVIADEYGAPRLGSADESLDTKFKSEEQRVSLEAELECLLQGDDSAEAEKND